MKDKTKPAKKDVLRVRGRYSPIRQSPMEDIWEQVKTLSGFVITSNLGVDEEICKTCDSIKDKEISELKDENGKLKRHVQFLQEEIRALELKTAADAKAFSLNEIVDEFRSDPKGKHALERAWMERREELKELVRKGEMSPIKFHRLMKGMNQKTLSEILKTKQPNITRIERPGYKPKIDTLKKLAKIFGVKMEDLIEE